MEDKMNGRLITPEEEEKIRYESVIYGDSFMAVKRLSESEFLKSLITLSTPPEDKRVPCKMDLVEFGKVNKNKDLLTPIFDDPSQIEWKELTPRQLRLLSADRVNTSMTIHKDGVDKNLRGMTIKNMYVDDFYYNLPEPPDTTAIEVIQTTDYERISRISDYYSYSHYLIDAFVLDAMIEEKEKNNDNTVGKISYRCSIPYNYRMHNPNHNENVPARRRHSRHR